MYATGRDFNTLMISVEPQTKPYLDLLSLKINSLQDRSAFSNCGTEASYFDPYKYDGVCLYIFDLLTIFGMQHARVAPGYKFTDLEVANMPFLMDNSLSQILAYCFLKKTPGLCEIWDLCVLSPFRSRGPLSATVGGHVGRKFIHDITKYGIGQLCPVFWAIIKPNNIASASVFFNNDFRIIKVSNTDSSGNLTGYTTENIEVSTHNQTPLSPEAVEAELVKFTDVSDHIEIINKKTQIRLYFPPETVIDIVKLVDIEYSEVGGKFVFKEPVETIIGPNGSTYFKAYVYDELIKGTPIIEGNPSTRAGISSLSFHTHPYSAVRYNHRHVQIPSVPDIKYALRMYQDYGPGFITTFVFTTGGFFTINFKLDFANMLIMSITPVKHILKIAGEVYYSKNNAECGLDDVCFAELPRTLAKHERVIDLKEFSKQRSIGKVDVINRISFNDLIMYEKETTGSSILECFFNHYVSVSTFPFDASKIRIFSCKFINIDEVHKQQGLFFEVEDVYPDDLVITNIPPMNPSIKVSPLGNCENESYRRADTYGVFHCD